MYVRGLAGLIDDVAAAISTREGWNADPANRPTRNNNPGDLRDSSGTIWPSLPHDSAGFVIFPTAAAGWAALLHDLELKAGRGLTLAEIIRACAPASDGNDTAGYLAYVSNRTGVSPSDTLTDSGSSGADLSPDGGAWDAVAILDSQPWEVYALGATGVILAALLLASVLD